MSAIGTLLGLLALVGTGLSTASSIASSQEQEATKARVERAEREQFERSERDRRRQELTERRTALARAMGTNYPFMPQPKEPGVGPIATPDMSLWKTLGAVGDAATKTAAGQWGAATPTTGS